MDLLQLHLDLYEKYADESLRSIATNGEHLASAARNDGPARSDDEKTHSHILPYEPLKHFFKIYVNNFPGAKDLRTQLMETHSVAEARAIIKG